VAKKANSSRSLLDVRGSVSFMSARNSADLATVIISEERDQKFNKLKNSDGTPLTVADY